jgi:manganese efflux pump family protein
LPQEADLDAIGILGTALGLSMDAFSVAIVIGATLPRHTLRHYFRIPFHFGLFQFTMPLVGYFVGVSIEPFIQDYDHWVAMILLTLVGVNIIRESFSEQAKPRAADPTRGIAIVILSVATSIDALVVGMSLGFLNVSILSASMVIGVVCALCSLFGLSLGKKVGVLSGQKITLAGGAILIAIGVTVVLEHLHFLST